MLTIRKASERGHADHGWLNTYHTFSFANYYDPAHMGFRSLRVLNDDRVSPGRGFGAHAHRDMEILTYVLEGNIAHKDSMGEQHTFGPNTIQTMSAGTGIVHSEFNASPTDPLHFLQIWIEPAVGDVDPSYQQMAFAPAEKQGKLRLLAAPEASPATPAATIHQDARIYAGVLGSGEALKQTISPGRYAWLQVARGNMTVNGQQLKEGDGVSATKEQEFSLVGTGPDGSEFLFFDLA